MNISEDSKIIKNTEYTNITEDPNITNDSKITNDPMIKNDLIVTNDSKITHNQMITDDSKITNNLMISDDSKVANDPMIIDDSNVANDSIITNDPKIIISNDSTNTNDPIITNDSKITGDSKKDEKHDRSESSPLREYKINESRLLSSILDEIVQVYLEYNNIGWTNNFDFDEVLEKYKSKARKIFDYLIENSNIKHYEVIIGNDVSSKIEEIEKELEREKINPNLIELYGICSIFFKLCDIKANPEKYELLAIGRTNRENEEEEDNSIR
ncbi:21979_t:CDS:2 [Rhizophagus irregularis]|nr:21979_t:CDS:2 [Rhizophagus irregularis]